MSNRALYLAALTVVFWTVAFTVLGGLMMGDCFGDQEVLRQCAEHKDKVMYVGLGAAGVIYFALAWVLWKLASRPRSGRQR